MGSTCGGVGSTERDMQRSAEKTRKHAAVELDGKALTPTERPHGSLLGRPLACESTENTFSAMVAMASNLSHGQVDRCAPEALQDLQMGRSKWHDAGSAERTGENTGWWHAAQDRESLRSFGDSLTVPTFLVVTSFWVLSRKGRE